jgi:OOP family OmpA-OmpF porin
MNKVLTLLVWLLGLAAIAWLCGGRQASAPAALPSATTAPPAISTPAATAPAAASAVGSTTASAAPPPPAASPAARAAASRIDEVLKDKVVEFRSGSAVLTSGGMITLDAVRPVLRDNSTLDVEIQGHTDNTGTEATNLALSQERADAVKKYLADKGVAPERMVARGYGASRPVADNNNAEGRARNRRIAFSLEEKK